MEESATSVVPSAPTGRLVTVEAPVAAMRSPLAVTVDRGIALATEKLLGDSTTAESPATNAVRPVIEVPVEAV